MNKTITYVWILCVIWSCQGVGSRKKHSIDTIKVFAAASLTDVLSEIIDSFELHHSVRVITNLASSGTLARQIVQGGEPDLYISANVKWADYLDSLGFLINNTRKEIIRNELVIIAPLNSSLQAMDIDKLNLPDLLGNERISIGDPAHVPAGKYARQALESYGWYTMLTDQILPTKDVRSTLMMVEMEETPLGIVYMTDALKSNKVKIISSFPIESHLPIIYMSGLCTDKPTAKEFFAYLSGPEMVNVWKKYGFNHQ